jgi:hypothetical protein
METLPAPQVVRCYVHTGFQPQLPAMRLRWDPNALGTAERLWYLPGDVCLTGSAPEDFGVTIQRRAADAYAVRVLWNNTCLSWCSLTRVQLLTSALDPLLRAMGTDLWYLLDQPVTAEFNLPSDAA